MLVPYFKAGLENNERCLWVTGKAFDAEQARSALRAAVPDLDKRERDKQIEIANGDEWYAAGEKLQPYELVKGLEQCERDALDLGYSGLRTNGNCAWVSQAQWADFQDSETLVQKTVRGRRMICMCSYSTEQVNSGAHLEVMEHHDLAVPSARGSATRRRSDAAGAINPVQTTDGIELDQSLERQQRTFDLAMTASDMGIWRSIYAGRQCLHVRPERPAALRADRGAFPSRRKGSES